jgi:Na+/proline symporter
MHPLLLISIILGYFIVLLLVSWITSRGATNDSFFIGNHKSPWYLVAFGMIGTSISGVTFVSVPGFVHDTGFSYLQMILGNFVGYIIIATILMPMFYKLKLTSIYSYLDVRFGGHSYKTGAAFFLLSRTIGSAVRLFLAASVLQLALFDSWHVPFAVTVFVTITFIWIYTYKGGIKTIIWTDSLQTLFFLVAVGITVYVIASELHLNFQGLTKTIIQSEYSKVFFFNDFLGNKLHFVKQFLAGILICVSMTGLDQDLMQKNLSCRNIKDAQKNMLVFSVIMVIVNFMFLCLGVFLYLFAQNKGIALPLTEVGKIATDKVYPFIATGGYLPVIASVVFLLGLIASTCASSDSALTALTTSFVFDILGKDKDDEEQLKRSRQKVHLGFSVLLLITVLLFKALNDKSIIDALFTIAAYTYGPLLGMFTFGFFTKHQVFDKAIPYIAVASPLVSFILSIGCKSFFGYSFGYEILVINASLTMLGMYLFRKKE